MYKYAVRGLYKVPAEDAGRELDRIREKRGTLNAEDVVEESRDKGSVLHDIFEWDNEKAADSWRIEQARGLIRNITVSITTEKQEVCLRAFHCVAMEKDGPRSYVPLNVVCADKDAYASLLENCKRDAQNFIRKYDMLKEAKPIVGEMFKLISQ